MPHEPLPDPESEQLAALLGDGTARLVYGLLHRRRSSPPTAAEIGLFLSAAASASMPAGRVIQTLQTHFDIKPLCEDCLKGKRQYQETYASYSEQIRHAWPENIHAAIVAEEKRRRAAKGKKSAGSDGAQ